MFDLIFKGYIATKNKRPIEKFKGRDSFRPKSDVWAGHEFAGVLSDDCLLIDIDDRREAETFVRIIQALNLNCLVLRTRRGVHAYFRNDPNRPIDRNRTGAVLGVGLRADIKTGKTAAIAVLKTDGKMRDIIQNPQTLDTVPMFFRPTKAKNTALCGLRDGDGRNSALFSFIYPLQDSGFSKEEIHELVGIINKFVFRDPLPTSELKTILRDESFKKVRERPAETESETPSFFIDGMFRFDKFARWLIDAHHVVKIGGVLHIYRDGVYRPGDAVIESEMIRHIPNLTRSRRAEVLAYLDILITDDAEPAAANFISFNNGIYDIVTGRLFPHSPDVIITNRIRHDFNDKAYSSVADRTLSKIASGDLRTRQLLEEIAGYCFYRRNELGKAFFLIGGGSNGKSTYISMIREMLGSENVSSLDLSELDDRFKTAELSGKLANLGDDIDSTPIHKASMFKKLVTGDKINVERKGLNPFEFVNRSKLIFSANDIPAIRDGSGAVARRLVVVPFDAVFSPSDEDFDPFIKYKLLEKDSIEYFTRLAVHGLRRVIRNNRFTETARSVEETVDYEIINNPVIAFLKTRIRDSLIGVPSRFVFDDYLCFCRQEGTKPASHIEFSRQAARYYNFKTAEKRINGEKFRVFSER